jgi:hypothetical protein
MPGAQTSARTGEPGFRAARSWNFQESSLAEHAVTRLLERPEGATEGSGCGGAADSTELKQEVEPEQVYSRSTRPTIDRRMSSPDRRSP